MNKTHEFMHQFSFLLCPLPDDPLEKSLSPGWEPVRQENICRKHEAEKTGAGLVSNKGQRLKRLIQIAKTLQTGVLRFSPN